MPGRSARPRLLTRDFLLLMAASFGTLFAIGALLPTLPRFVEGPLDGGSVAVGVVMGAASIVAVVTQPFAGRLGDRRGRRVLLVAGTLLMAAVGFAYVPADSLAALLPLRLASGLGEGLFFVGGALIANDLAPDERRGEAVSYYTLSLYGGLALGPLVGETVLGDGRFDRTWLVVGAAALTAAACALGVRETRPPGPPQRGGRRPFLHPASRGPGLVLLVAMLGFGGFNAFVALYALELGLESASPLFALFAVIVVLVRSVGARIPDALGAERTATIALAGLAAGLAVMGAWRSAVGLYAGTTLFALGQSLAFPALLVLVVRRALPSERGSAVGSFTMFVDVALGLGAVTLGVIASAAGYRGVFFAASAAAVVGLVLLLGLDRSRRVA